MSGCEPVGLLTEGDLASMRSVSSSALPAACTVTRASTEVPATDPETGQLIDPDPVAVWSGPCRVRSMNTQGATGLVGALHESLGRYIVTVPHDAAGLLVDDFVTVSTGTDAELVGRPLRIIDLYWSEYQIDRRLLVEDLQQPRVVA